MSDIKAQSCACTCHLEAMFCVVDAKEKYGGEGFDIMDAEGVIICNSGEQRYANLILYALNEVEKSGGDGYFTACRIHQNTKSQRFGEQPWEEL